MSTARERREGPRWSRFLAFAVLILATLASVVQLQPTSAAFSGSTRTGGGTLAARTSFSGPLTGVGRSVFADVTSLQPVGYATPQQLRSMSAGDETCGVTATGTLWCWGKGRTWPAQIGTGSSWLQVAGDYGNNCAVQTDRSLWCWGENGFGQLGNGTSGGPATTAPGRVGADTDWASVSVGWFHACAVRTDGSLWCWGSSVSGATGGGRTGDMASPHRVGTDANWRGVTTGKRFSCGIRTEGTLWCWGSNTDGLLGIGTTTPDGEPPLLPTQVGTRTDWVEVSALNETTCARPSDGTLWCWGSNNGGQLADGTTTDRSSPVQVGTSTAWTSVSTGEGHQCGLRTGGSLWCWGWNNYQQLGDGTSANNRSPQRIGAGSTWTSVVAGVGQTCATRTDSTTWCWGRNGDGQLGDGTTTSRSTPVQTGLTTRWDRLSRGPDKHTCARRVDRTLWCWGLNREGQLGDGSTSDHTEPRQVGTTSTWEQVSAGWSHTCATRTDATLWCWGSNSYLELGQGPGSGGPAGRVRPDPLQVGVDTWTTVAAGNRSTCGVRTDQSLWCWGNNAYGQLGDGTDVFKNQPTRIAPGTRWTAISAGTGSTADEAMHTCGVQADRTLWCWGSNSRGQLGDGTTTNRLSPVRVGAGSSWSTVTAGDQHTCAARTDGSLWCWGDGRRGQLGNGTTTDRSTPERVDTTTSWSAQPGAVTATGSTTCAGRQDGSLWCWGGNSDGQVGDGTTNDRAAPARAVVGQPARFALTRSALLTVP